MLNVDLGLRHERMLRTYGVIVEESNYQVFLLWYKYSFFLSLVFSFLGYSWNVETVVFVVVERIWGIVRDNEGWNYTKHYTRLTVAKRLQKNKEGEMVKDKQKKVFPVSLSLC